MQISFKVLDREFSYLDSTELCISVKQMTQKEISTNNSRNKANYTQHLFRLSFLVIGH